MAWRGPAHQRFVRAESRKGEKRSSVLAAAVGKQIHEHVVAAALLDARAGRVAPSSRPRRRTKAGEREGERRAVVQLRRHRSRGSGRERRLGPVRTAGDSTSSFEGGAEEHPPHPRAVVPFSSAGASTPGSARRHHAPSPPHQGQHHLVSAPPRILRRRGRRSRSSVRRPRETRSPCPASNPPPTREEKPVVSASPSGDPVAAPRLESSADAGGEASRQRVALGRPGRRAPPRILRRHRRGRRSRRGRRRSASGRGGGHCSSSPAREEKCRRRRKAGASGHAGPAPAEGMGGCSTRRKAGCRRRRKAGRAGPIVCGGGGWVGERKKLEWARVVGM
jgi:hypothetical protein